MLTRKDAAIIGAYTGICCGPFSDMHQFIEEIMGRPVWTHELAFPEIWEAIKKKAKPYFLEICATEDGE